MSTQLGLEKAWISQKGYLQGVIWLIGQCAISNLNDILIKGIGSNLPGTEVAFFRFLFSALILLPFMLVKGKSAFRTNHLKVHGIRSLLLFLAIAPWCYGVSCLPLTLATVISFTTPFFVLPLSMIFLKEHVGWRRWAATLAGFVGILISLNPQGEAFNPMAWLLVMSTLMFATLDVINKRLLVQDESLLSMLFYSAVGTTLLGFLPALYVWQTPALTDLALLALLGGGGNLILFCILKASAATEVSALQPYRYVELLFSALFGYLIFSELPSSSTLMGAAVIVPSTLYIAYYELRKNKA